MSIALTPSTRAARSFGPHSAGTLMSAREFDRAEFEPGWRYELIHGVLVVSPSPLMNERDPNEELGRLLRNYQEFHPQGSSLDHTAPEETVEPDENRRRADRAIWAGLGRLPKLRETPAILAEFVSAGKRDRKRDYEEKRDEYLAMGVKEYWILDRFTRTLTVYVPAGKSHRKKVHRENQPFRSPLLPGFELPLARLFDMASRWDEPGA